MDKDRPLTEQKLLDAVTFIVQKKGFSSLGVNSVSETAGVSKVLIYRYFGSFESLLEKWVLNNNYWITDTNQIDMEIAKIIKVKSSKEKKERTVRILNSLFQGQLKSLRGDSIKREVIRWFLAEKNSAASEAMKIIEKRGTEISESFRKIIFEEKDVEAMAAVIISGIYYLSLVSDRVSAFNGIPLDNQDGWDRISNAVKLLTENILNNEE